MSTETETENPKKGKKPKKEATPAATEPATTAEAEAASEPPAEEPAPAPAPAGDIVLTIAAIIARAHGRASVYPALRLRGTRAAEYLFHRDSEGRFIRRYEGTGNGDTVFPLAQAREHMADLANTTIAGQEVEWSFLTLDEVVAERARIAEDRRIQEELEAARMERLAELQAEQARIAEEANKIATREIEPATPGKSVGDSPKGLADLEKLVNGGKGE